MRTPVMVFPNLRESAEPLATLLARFNLYGSKVYKLSNGDIQKIVILAGVKVNELSMENIADYKYLEINQICDPTRNVIKFAFLSRKFLKEYSVQPRLLISSDLYFGFLASILISLFRFSPFPIQVSVHGSVLRNGDSAFKNFLRKCYIAKVLNSARSIRTVSRELELQILSQFNLDSQKIFIAHIPIDFPATSHEQKSQIIAFVGRFHEERGVKEWVDIVCRLYKIRQDFSVYVIGDGPLRSYVKSSFTRYTPNLSMTDFGYLTRSEVNRIWPRIKILLSPARSEGYGLSLREAILSSSFVVARSSSGSEVLKDELPNLVFTYSNINEAISYLDKLLDSHFPATESDAFRAQMVKLNQYSLGAIASSWIN